MKKPFYTPNRNEKLAADLGYVISTDGSVITGPNGKVYAQSANSSGHLVFSFGPKKGRKKCQVHRFVAWFKFGKAIYEPNIVCRHLDGNPANNHPDNIALGSQSDNMMDRPAKERHSHAWNTSRHTLKYDHHAVIDFYKKNGFKKTMIEFGIPSKGTLSFIINKTQTAKPVPLEERPMKKRRMFTKSEKSFLDKLAGKSGLYALYEHEVCLYVGKADCLQKRLVKHLKSRFDVTHIKAWDYSLQLEGLSYLGFKKLLAFYEAVKIESLKPLENKQRPNLSPETVWKLPLDAQRKIVDGMPSLLPCKTVLDA